MVRDESGIVTALTDSQAIYGNMILVSAQFISPLTQVIRFQEIDVTVSAEVQIQNWTGQLNCKVVNIETQPLL